MLDEEKSPYMYWKVVVHTKMYIINKAQIRVKTKNNPYEFWYGKSLFAKYFGIFGSKCFIKRHDENIEALIHIVIKGYFYHILHILSVISLIIKE